MPLQKFQNLADAERALWCSHPDEEYLERWCKIVQEMTPRSFPTGVFRYRTIEEADRERKAWLRSSPDSVKSER
jgi:hypothetical protein